MPRPKRSTAARATYRDDPEEEGVAGRAAEKGDEDYEPEMRSRGSGVKRRGIAKTGRGRKKARRKDHFSSLPTKLLDVIISYLHPDNYEDLETLANLCLVSKSCLRVAQPRLYKSFTFELYGDSAGASWISCTPSSCDFLNVVHQKRYHHLADLVHHVTFFVEMGGEAEEDLLDTEYGQRWRAEYDKDDDVDRFEDEQERKDFWFEVQKRMLWGDGASGAQIARLIDVFPSLKSFGVYDRYTGELGELLADLAPLPDLEEVTMVSSCYQFEACALPDDGFTALRRMELSARVSAEEEVLLRRWCTDRRVALSLTVVSGW